MFYINRAITGMALGFFLLISCFQLGCGGEECTRNSDCTEKGKNYICKVDVSSGKKKCVEKKVTPPTCPGTCANDTDCSDCEDGKTKCINLVCSKPADTCPSSCSADSDCSNCSDDKTSCVNGSCAKKESCPDTCQGDPDCADCGDGKTACINGVCDNPPACPSACADDNDCKDCDAGKQQCVNNSCGGGSTCPATCKTNDDCKDCAAGNNFCKDGTCDQPPTTCPSSCTEDVECTHCQFGLNYCVKGQCSQQEQNKCPTGCTNDSDCKDCSDNRTACQAGVCTKPLCPSSCTADTDCASCPNRTACQSGKCAATACPSSCSSDAECSSGCGSKTKCVAGQCEDPQTFCGRCGTDSDCSIAGCGTKTKCVSGQCQDGNTCPSFCRVDQDCDLPGCGNKKQCINNKCISNVCPSSCTTGADCIAPACGNRTSCISGTCQNQPTCPSSCTTNADCASAACGNRTQCRSGTCQAAAQCPSFCITSTECAPCGTGYTCDILSFSCKQGGSTCPSSCVINSQCAPCGSGYTCQSGQCKQGGTTSNPAGRTCSSTSTCPSGYRCITITSENKSYCFQECTGASGCASNTTDGRTSCLAFAEDGNGNTISVCMGENSATQDCGYSGNKQAVCKSGQNPRLYCAKTGKCTAVIVQKTAGDICNNSSNTTEPIRTCDSTLGLVCSETTGKCITATLAKEGEHCDATGQNLGKQTICDTKSNKDLICVSFSSAGFNSACHAVCDPKKTGQCSHKPGTTCFQAFADGRGLCLDMTCTQDSDCLFSNYECVTLQSGSKACFPTPPPGPKTIGQVCKDPVSTNGCKAGLECLQLQNATSGFCSQECIASCPSMNGKTGTCLTVGSRKLCFVKCTTDSNCPTGLKCTSVNLGSASQQLCFP